MIPRVFPGIRQLIVREHTPVSVDVRRGIRLHQVEFGINFFPSTVHDGVDATLI